MKQYRVKPYTVAPWIFHAIEILRPREKLPVSKWAEANRVLPDGNSIPGPWRNSVTPYLVEIMDTFTEEDVEKIIFVKPAQVGGTSAMENMTQEKEEESLILPLGKPYKFEGQTYTEVDLSALEDISAADMAAVNKILSRKGVVTPMPEMTLDFCIYMAAKVSKLPAEFFMGLPARDTIKLKNLVTGFLYGGDGED
ncbi:phage terminase large subunit family protein [Oscillospiraceae bacterium OttesenSCG-928-G22]|nr:phage terminase large subunit family protein [Oscillospiraceae bacterium OttesenSCG-928-G22]